MMMSGLRYGVCVGANSDLAAGVVRVLMVMCVSDVMSLIVVCRLTSTMCTINFFVKVYFSSYIHSGLHNSYF